MGSDSAALVRLLKLLEWARPADVRAVASAMPEAQLAAAIDAVEGRLSLALREYVLTEGSSGPLIALARHAIVASDLVAENTVGRILMRFDQEADAAFFQFEFSGNLHAKARRAILRGRKGVDGRAVIPPRVKQLLLDALAADTDDGGEPDRQLMADVAFADDPVLVRALLPHASQLTAPEAARVIMTLDAYGYRAEAKGHRGLWAGRGSAFTILGVQRFSTLSSMVEPDKDFVPPPARSVKAVSLRQYRELLEEQRVPRRGALLELRKAALLALRAGTVSAAEILEHTRPAALTVSLAFSPMPDTLPADERRAIEDMRALIAQYAIERLDGDPKRWARAIRWVRNYEDGLPALLASTESDVEKQSATDFNTLVSDEFDTRNILIALAPRQTADRFLATKRMKTTVTATARSIPLSRSLVENILKQGTVTQRRRLAYNTTTPDSVLARLIDETEHTDIMFSIMDRLEVGQEIMERAYAAAPHSRYYKTWVTTWAPYTTGPVVNALRCKAYDPGWVLSVLQDTIDSFDEPGRIAAYVMLADVAGVEAVWTVELNRAGSLEAMAAYVRASMASGSAEPLIEAAQASPIEDHTEARRLRASRKSRTDGHLDHLPDAFVDLIRSRLDGQTNRWLELLELFQSKPDVSDEELIAEFACPPHSPTPQSARLP